MWREKIICRLDEGNIQWWGIIVNYEYTKGKVSINEKFEIYFSILSYISTIRKFALKGKIC